MPEIKPDGKKEAGGARAWLKKYNTTLLRTSAVIFALCYALSYMGGTSDNPVFMMVSLIILIIANVIAAVIK